VKCYFILKEFDNGSDLNPPVRGYTFSYSPSAKNKCVSKLSGDLYMFTGTAFMELTDLGELPKQEVDPYITFYCAKIQKIKAPESPVEPFDDDEMEA